MMYWNLYLLSDTKLQTHLEPTHMMYWNLVLRIWYILIGTWTDTYDVLKLETAIVSGWKTVSWTDTYDVLKRQMNKPFLTLPAILNRHIWCIETVLLKIHLNFSMSLEPTHMMYWNWCDYTFWIIKQPLNRHIWCIETTNLVKLHPN